MPEPRIPSPEEIEDLFLQFISQPSHLEWISSEKIAAGMNCPLPVVIRLICIFSQEGIIGGVRDKKTGKYYVKTIWFRPKVP